MTVGRDSQSSQFSTSVKAHTYEEVNFHDD